MAKQEIKFKVTIKELSFEYEGSRDIGQTLQAGLNRSLGALLDTQRAAMAIPATMPTPQPTLFDDRGPVDPSTNGHAAGDHSQSATVTPPQAPAPATEKVKRTRKSGENTAISLLRALKAEKFFVTVHGLTGSS